MRRDADADDRGPIPIRLVEGERKLLLNGELLSAPLKDRLRIGLLQNGRVTCYLTVEGTADLASAVADEIDLAEGRPRQAKLDDIHERLADALEVAGLPRPSSPKADRPLQRPSAETPYEEPVGFGHGLSGRQIEDLLFTGWEHEQSAVRISGQLNCEDTRAAVLVQNARRLLSAIAVEGAVQATATGRLSRAFVEQMTERLDLPAEDLELTRQYRKVLNERDVFPLHILRSVVEIAGLLRCENGRFAVTDQGAELLPPRMAGELYRSLFIAVFREFDLGRLDRIPAGNTFQKTLGVGLWVVSQYGNEWRTAGALAPAVVPDTVVFEMARPEQWDLPRRLVEIRLLGPLEWFALVQSRATEEREHGIRVMEYCKTALFDRFLQFVVHFGWSVLPRDTRPQ